MMPDALVTPSQPRVSVALAVYNSEHFIRAALESLQHQTFTDFEIVIGDDGSTDRSLAIVQQIAATDSRLVVIAAEHQGIAKTRNLIFTYCRGEYIAVMDADDIALKDRLIRQVDFLDSHPDVVCVGGTYQLMDEAGRLFKNRFDLPLDNQSIQEQLLKGLGGMHHPCLMFHRSAFDQIGLYNETMVAGIDIDLCLRLGEMGQLANVAEPVLRYRIHPGSITTRKRDQQMQQVRLACERAWQRRGIQGQFEADGDFRATTEARSQHRFMLKYGWWAFKDGQRYTSLLFALKAIALWPWNFKGWKLAACTLFKSCPPRESP